MFAGSEHRKRKMKTRSYWELLFIAIFLFLQSHIALAKNFGEKARLTHAHSRNTYVLLHEDNLLNSEMQISLFYDPSFLIFDSIKAKEFSKIAKKPLYKKSKKQCLKGVRLALSKLHGIKHLNLSDLPKDAGHPRKKRYKAPGRSADNFIKFALDNPISLCQKLKLANVTEFPDLAQQEGTIHLFEKKRCGFSIHGHAEVRTGKKQACSDHCRSLKTNCKATVVLAPVTNCHAVLARKMKEDFPTNPKAMKKPIIRTRLHSQEDQPPAI